MIPNSFEGLDKYLATVARLFAADNDLLAVEILSSAKTRIEWYSHDNWDGGFDIYNLFLNIPIPLYKRVENQRSDYEEAIQNRLQSVSSTHTSDHIHSVHIVVEVQESEGWKDRAHEWLRNSSPKSEDVNNPDSATTTILCRPNVFHRPAIAIVENQVAVMMPFATEYEATYHAICKAAESLGLIARRVDDMWDDSVIVQDIFSLIYGSAIVVVDFSGKNPNVLYETGIAHTLGRQVVPITRVVSDVPFDLRHHRALTYLPNDEGYVALEKALSIRLSTITGRQMGKRGP